MKTKSTILTLLIITLSNLSTAQVLIAGNITNNTPHPSAVLEISDTKRGILLPQVPLIASNDNTSVPTPVKGLLVQNTNTEKVNFWANGQWNRIFQVADGLAIIQQTENFSGNSGASTTISTFPSSMPLFTANSSTANWTNIGATATVVITNTSNTTYINIEGMSQINNSNVTQQEFQFAIGVFVNNQLKLASKYTNAGKNFICNWRKFNLAGIISDLPTGTHTISVYGRNLPKITTGYSAVTYGGNASNCSNINNDMARIFVTAQVTQ